MIRLILIHGLSSIGYGRDAELAERSCGDSLDSKVLSGPEDLLSKANKVLYILRHYCEQSTRQ